jgi:hypothetical protein
MLSKHITLSLLNCITETSQVTKRRKYPPHEGHMRPAGRMLANPELDGPYSRNTIRYTKPQ